VSLLPPGSKSSGWLDGVVDSWLFEARFSGVGLEAERLLDWDEIAPPGEDDGAAALFRDLGLRTPKALLNFFFDVPFILWSSAMVHA